MTNSLFDIRFAFKFDNPFPNDPNKESLKKLKKYLISNASKFTEINWLNDSRYLVICPELTQLYGKEISTGVSDVSNNPISNYVKDFISGVQGVSQEIKDWAMVKTAPKETEVQIDNTNNNDSDGDYSENNMNDPSGQAYNDYVPLMPNKYQLPSTLSITNYDISNDKAISYEDLRKLTINIARSRLVPDIVKDETVLKLEAEKRKQLIQQITRYRNVRAIAALDDSDLTDKSIAELETTLEQCQKYHENFKTLEMFKRGFAVGGVAYDMIFPDGIPISSTKRLKFNGVGKEILSTMFDPHTSVGLAFSNILQKHNIHVSDELLILVAFAGTCVSKIKVEDIAPKIKQETTKPIVHEPVSDEESYTTSDELEAVSDEE